MGIKTMCGLKWGFVAGVVRRFARLASMLVLALATQRGALGRHDLPTVAQKQKSPLPTVPEAGQGGSARCYWLIR
jgi:hypothetical protein